MGRRKQEQEVYHVEVITAARVANDFSWEYLVKWAGYESDADSWEPQDNVHGCEALLGRFWKHVGVDEEDYPAGHLCQASQKWIKKERKRFANTYPDALEQEKKRAKAEKAKASSVASSSTASAPKSKRKRKKTEVVPDHSDGERSSEGEPLSKKFKPTESTSAPPTHTKDKGKQRVIGTPPPPAASSDDPNSLFTPPSAASKAKPFKIPDTSADASQQDDLASSPTNASPGSRNVASSAFPVPTEQHRWSFKPQQTSTKPGSSLATKQRLASAALTITPAIKPPKIKIKKFSQTIAESAPAAASVPPLTSAIPLPRRHSAIVDAARARTPTFYTNPDSPVVVQQPSTSIGLPVLTQSPPMHPFDVTSDPPPFSAMTDQFDPTDDYRMEDYMSEFLLHSSPPPPPPPPPHVDAAEQLLREIMPLELSAPLPDEASWRKPLQPATEAAEEPENHAPIATLLRTKLPPLPKIPKKYQWQGPLHSAEGEQLEHICDVLIDELSAPIPGGLRMDIFLQALESLRCEGFHDQLDTEQVLLACKKSAHQFARLVSPADSGITDLAALASTMNKRSQTIILPLNLDNKLVAILLIFPTNARHIVRQLGVPTHFLQNSKTLVVALLQWNTPNYPQLQWRKDLEESTYQAPVSLTQLRHNSMLLLSMQALRFPQEINDFMSQAGRPFCVWWEGGDGLKQRKWETKALLTILQHCGAKDVGFKADVRVIFVHVASINTLHRLPGFVDRRTKRPEINFYTYGTHHKVPPNLWGVRAIYPIGGVVAFTASALLANPEVLRLRIKQISEHELWDCYVLPSVVGLASKLSAQDEDPFDLFAKGKLFTSYCLQLIEDGDIAMMECAPLEPHLVSSNATPWLATNLAHRDFSQADYFEQAMEAFAQLCSGKPEPKWLPEADLAVRNELRKMEMQPCMMAEYRRFVVIKGPQENVARDKDGFEWVTAEEFDFRDHRFEKWDGSQMNRIDDDDWSFFPFN